PGGTVRKGTLLGEAEIARLREAGLAEIVVARLQPGEVHENDAAGRLAAVLAGANVRVDPAFTGRANLFAEKAGVLRVDAAAVDAFNQLDEAITLATLPANAP